MCGQRIMHPHSETDVFKIRRGHYPRGMGEGADFGQIWSSTLTGPNFVHIDPLKMVPKPTDRGDTGLNFGTKTRKNGILWGTIR